MENTETVKPGSNKGLIIFLIVIIVTLLAAIFILYMNKEQQLQNQTDEATVVQEALEQQKVMLRQELSDLGGQYDMLKSNNDSMTNLIGVQKVKIKKLLGESASNAQLIIKYKKELGTLREVLKSYIAQVDSLNTRNQQLVQENTEVKTSLNTARNENVKLSEEKSELSSQVKKAKVLSASNIVITGQSKKAKEEDKLSKIVKLKVCMVIRENSVVEAGNKDIYIRITRPDGIVMASENNFFDFQGTQIVYSAKRQIEYENKDLDVCIFWDNTNNQLVLGEYTIDIFAEGNMIGTSKYIIEKRLF